MKDSKIVKDLFMESQDKGYVRYKGLPLETAGGQRVDIEFIANVYDNDHQRVIQCNIRDITESKRMEEELKESEKNFRNSMESSTIGIRIMGDANSTVYANQALLDIFGYKNIDELRASPPQEHYTPESHASFLRRHNQCARGEPLPDKLELDIIRKGGTIRHLQLSSKEVLWDGKQHHQLLYNDITERMQAEEELKASEQNLRNFLDNSMMGIRIRTEGQIVYANQALLDIFGCENIDELRATPPEKHYTPEYYADFLLRKEKISHGEPVSDKIEVDIIRKDGSIRHLQIFGRQVLWKGKTQTQTFYNDITEHMQAEIIQKESENTLRTYLDNAPDGVYLSELNGIFLYGNKKAEEIMGYNKGELIGSNFLELNLIPTKYLEKAAELLKLNALGKNTGPDEFELIKKDQSHIWVEINTATIRQKNNNIVLGFVRNITERKQAEEEKQRTRG